MLGARFSGPAPRPESPTMRDFVGGGLDKKLAELRKKKTASAAYTAEAPQLPYGATKETKKMKSRGAVILGFLLFAALAFGQSGSLYVSQFPGSTVGAKVANAMNSCPAAPVPCILVIDPGLAAWASGTMPTLCANCTLQDMRSGGVVPPGLSSDGADGISVAGGATVAGPLNANVCPPLPAVQNASCYASLSAAITAACTSATPAVYLPADYTASLSGYAASGYYSLLPICNGLDIGGAGINSGSTIKIANGMMAANPNSNYSVFYYSSGTTPLQNVHIHDLAVDFNGTNNLVPSSVQYQESALLYAPYANDITIERVLMLNNPGTQSISFGNNVSPQTCQRAHIRDNVFHNFGRGVAGNIYAPDHSSVYLQCDDSDLTGNLAFNDTMPTSPVAAAYEIHARRSRIQNNTAKNTREWGNLVASVTNFQDNTVTGNLGYNVYYGVRIWTSSGFTFDDFHIDNNVFVLNAASNYGGIVYGDDAGPPYVTLTNGTISGNQVSQFGSLAGTNLIASGIGLAFCSDVTISGNRIWNMSGRGIDLACGTRVRIEGNTVYDTGQGGNAGYTQGIESQAPSIDSLSVVRNEVYNVNAANYIKSGLGLNGTLTNLYVDQNKFAVANQQTGSPTISSTFYPPPVPTATSYCGVAIFSAGTTSGNVTPGCGFTPSHCTAMWIGSTLTGGALGANISGANVTLTASASNSSSAAVFCSQN